MKEDFDTSVFDTDIEYLKHWRQRLQNIMNKPVWERKENLIDLICDALKLSNVIRRKTKGKAQKIRFNSRITLGALVECICRAKNDYYPTLQEDLSLLLKCQTTSIRNARKKIKDKLNIEYLQDFKTEKDLKRINHIVEWQLLVLFKRFYEKLGFDEIININNRFPDLVLLKDNKKVFGELETESKNFYLHRHPASKCDYLICWIHNWRKSSKEGRGFVSSPPKNLKIISMFNKLVDNKFNHFSTNAKYFRETFSISG